MVTFKHKLRMFVSVYFNNYFIRGVTRFSSIIAMLTMIATFITVYFGKAYVIEIFIPIIAVAVIGFTLFGKWDYSNKGTRTPDITILTVNHATSMRISPMKINIAINSGSLVIYGFI